MSTFSNWRTNVRYGLGFRDVGGLTLIRHRGVFVLLTDRVLPVEADSLTEAIAKADAHIPPEGWSHVVGLWLAPGWKVKSEEGGWGVFDEEGTRKTKQVFERADLARKWCEVRNDRVGINLRGPKPKSAGGEADEGEEK